MTYRSTQPRPSQRPSDTSRAVAFAMNVRPRGNAVSAATNASEQSVRTPVALSNPNRSGARQWGTIETNAAHVDAVVRARRELELRRGEAESFRRAAARDAHPAGSSAGSTRRRSMHANSVYSNVVALRGSAAPSGGAQSAPSPASQPMNPTRRHASTASTASVASATTATAAHNAGPGTLRRLSSVGPATTTIATVTLGATALAPAPVREERPAARARRVEARHLKVARPPRRRVKRQLVRTYVMFVAVFALAVGATSAIVMNARLAKNQLVLDSLRTDIGVEERSNESLRVAVAELEAPSHVLEMAKKMGLEPAEKVEFGPEVAASLNPVSGVVPSNPNSVSTTNGPALIGAGTSAEAPPTPADENSNAPFVVVEVP